QPTTAPSGAAVSPAPSVGIVDQFGNLTASTASVNVTASGPGTFAPGSVTTAPAVAGVTTFGRLFLNTPGTYQLTAASSGLANAQSNPFAVVPFGVTSVTPTATGVSVSFNTSL